jgi:uncharacterized membrane protein (UPF0127 family)
MGINKIIIFFLIIFMIFGAFVLYKFGAKNPKKSTIVINNHTFSVSVATTSAEQQKGLSLTKNLPQEQGMLFIFATPAKYAFWMKEMKFPLDIIFIKNNKIDTIAQDVPAPKTQNDTLPIYQPEGSVDSVLEINAGLAKKYGFKKNDAVKIKL